MNQWEYLEEYEHYSETDPTWNGTLGYISMLPQCRLYAKYVGEQKDGNGDKFPLFDLIDPECRHPRHKSTLSIQTLQRIGLNDIERRI